jgi:hypothetical protein
MELEAVSAESGTFAVLHNRGMSAAQTQSQGRLWYVRRGDVVKGPFQTALIKRYLLMGRIRASDELSLDKEVWHVPPHYPMFSPEKLEEDRATVMAREDERNGGDRRHNEAPDNPYKERRSGEERRSAETPETVARRKRRQRVLASLKPTRQSNVVPALVSAFAVALIVVSGFLFKPRGGGSEPDCDAAPAPGVNWSNCRKEGVDAHGTDLRGAVLRSARLTGANLEGVQLQGGDLAYADLVDITLLGSDLTGATLKGTTLRKAVLTGAKFEGADLSYADLSDALIEGAGFADARLDHAIWIDGRTCAPGSIGACR